VRFLSAGDPRPPARRAPRPRLRLGREPDPWEWPDWSYAIPDGTFGNRFDDPEGQYRVLYASAERGTTFRECLARFRPDPAIVAAEIAENDGDENSPRLLPAGWVALTWLQNRRIGSGRLIGEFCDIGQWPVLLVIAPCARGPPSPTSSRSNSVPAPR
jgi:RES domain